MMKINPMNTSTFGFKSGFAVRNPSGSKQAFTVIELLVVIGTLAVLGVMLLPALAGTQVQSKVTACAARYRQWAASANLYANDNQGWLPTSNTSPGGGYAWDVGTSLPGMLYPYGMDIPVWFCPMRTTGLTLDYANAWAQMNFGHPIQNINDLRNFWSQSYPGECDIDDDYWVQRYNGIPGPSPYFPTDYSTHTQATWPPWLEAGMPTCALYGWPKRLHDLAASYVPFVSDIAGSGNGGGLHSPVVGTSVTNISPDTAHYVNGVLIGINLAFADGHVTSHTPDQMRCVYGSGGGPPFWFY